KIPGPERGPHHRRVRLVLRPPIHPQESQDGRNSKRGKSGKKPRAAKVKDRAGAISEVSYHGPNAQAAGVSKKAVRFRGKDPGSRTRRPLAKTPKLGGSALHIDGLSTPTRAQVTGGRDGIARPDEGLGDSVAGWGNRRRIPRSSDVREVPTGRCG
ncbi:hypothetical protein THAOC_27622, partial [Thalassiosira oceanica]